MKTLSWRPTSWAVVLLLVSVVAVVIAQPPQRLEFAPLQRGLELQLAGIRLGSLAIERDEQGNLKPTCLLRVWGLPDFIVMATAIPAAQQPAGAPGMPGMPGAMPGMPGAMPGMPPGGIGGGGGIGMGSGFGGQPTLPGVMAGIGGMAQMAGAPGRMLPMPSGGGMVPGGMPFGGMPGVPGEEMMSGMPGMPGMMPGMMPGGMMPGMMPGGMMPGVGAGTGAAGAGGAIAPAPGELAWVIPVWIPLQRDQSLWLYKRNGASMSFLLDGSGMVLAITVAGRRFDSARTALGDPFKTIKLGDELQRVLLRYGQPDEVIAFNVQTLQPTTAFMTRNMVLRYHRSSNIEFTVVDYRVVRIFIFLPERVMPSH